MCISQIIGLCLHIQFIQTYTVLYVYYSSIKLEENEKGGIEENIETQDICPQRTVCHRHGFPSIKHFLWTLPIIFIEYECAILQLYKATVIHCWKKYSKIKIIINREKIKSVVSFPKGILIFIWTSGADVKSIILHGTPITAPFMQGPLLFYVFLWSLFATPVSPRLGS